jgi:hypothetical protein
MSEVNTNILIYLPVSDPNSKCITEDTRYGIEILRVFKIRLGVGSRQSCLLKAFMPDYATM